MIRYEEISKDDGRWISIRGYKFVDGVENEASVLLQACDDGLEKQKINARKMIEWHFSRMENRA